MFKPHRLITTPTLKLISTLVEATLIFVIALPLFAADSRLVTGKRITLPPLGKQQDVGSLPMNLILSPNGRYAITTDMGLRQSLWSTDTRTCEGVSHVTYFNNPGPNATTLGLYYGLVFGPDNTLYAAQGNNDTIAVLSLSNTGVLTQTSTINTRAHDFPSGLALDHRGYLYVANNDPSDFSKPSSIAIYAASSGAEVGRYEFTASFGRTPNFPLSIQVLKNGSKLYVASERDAGVYVFDTSSPASPSLIKKISTGSNPDALLLNGSQSYLFVGNGNSDTVSVISTATNKVVETLLLRPHRLKKVAGATPDGLALSPDGRTLYVSLGDLNAVAVVEVEHGSHLELVGYIPTGWYPSGVAATPNGKKLLFTNAKGTKTRNPDVGYQLGRFETDPEYIENIIEGNLSCVNVPEERRLDRLTEEVLANNGVSEKEEDDEDDARSFGADHRLDGIGRVSDQIKHVIYIIKENRTYDQVLGDIPEGNGDPSLVLFGQNVTPNLHALAKRFVLLDNFYDAGEVSGDGWPWSTQSMANEYVIKNLPYNYSDRGRNYDFEGQNNGYLTGGFPATDPDGKPLSAVFSAGLPPIPDVAQAPGGHIWDAARQAGLSYRNYGFYYSFGVKVGGAVVLPDNYPASSGLLPPGHDLAGISDFDYRRYDNDYPDSNAPSMHGCLCALTAYGRYNAPSRFAEWVREFQEMLAKDPSGKSVPEFMTVRFNHDHTQGFSAGKFTPRAEVADNDYAVGELVETISKSPIWKSTAIFVIEDDAQDGPDHVDAHRSTAYVISPHIPYGSVDSRFYNTDSILKTIELLLGIPPLTSYDAIADPIMDWSSHASNDDPYTAILPDKSIICDKTPAMAQLRPNDPMRKLVAASAKMDFEHPDSAPSAQLNEVIWKSVKGGRVAHAASASSRVG